MNQKHEHARTKGRITRVGRVKDPLRPSTQFADFFVIEPVDSIQFQSAGTAAMAARRMVELTNTSWRVLKVSSSQETLELSHYRPEE